MASVDGINLVHTLLNDWFPSIETTALSWKIMTIELTKIDTKNISVGFKLIDIENATEDKSYYS